VTSWVKVVRGISRLFPHTHHSCGVLCVLSTLASRWYTLNTFISLICSIKVAASGSATDTQSITWAVTVGTCITSPFLLHATSNRSRSAYMGDMVIFKVSIQKNTPLLPEHVHTSSSSPEWCGHCFSAKNTRTAWIGCRHIAMWGTAACNNCFRIHWCRIRIEGQYL